MDNEERARLMIKNCCKEYKAAKKDMLRAADLLASKPGLKLLQRRNIIQTIKLAEKEQEKLLKKILAYSVFL